MIDVSEYEFLENVVVVVVMMLLLVVLGVFVAPGPQREGEIVVTLGRLQAETDHLPPVLAVVVERQQAAHRVLPPPPLT